MERIDRGEQSPLGGTVAGAPESAAERRRRAARIMCVLGLLLAIILLGVGQLARIWIPFDIVNHFTAHLFLVAAACFIGAVMPRARGLSVLVVVVAGLVAIGLWPHYASHAGSPPVSGASHERIVRVMTFNSRLVNANWRAVADEITRHDADIVALVEIGRAQSPLFEALAAKYPHRIDCISAAYCPLAILSKFPIEDSNFRTRWRGPAFLRADFGNDLGGLTVVAVHATRPPFFATHLEQMRVLGDLMHNIGGERVALGDFNATPYSRTLSEVSRHSGLERITYLPSWPSLFDLPQIAIDHIFLSPGLRLAGAVRIGDNVGSDHYPLIADIAIPVPANE